MHYKNSIKKTLFIGVCLLITGCKNNSTIVDTGFYYWKTTQWNFSRDELKTLYETNSKHVFIKLFEVDIDPIFTNSPISKTNFNFYPSYNHYDETPLNLEFIPIVFIKNIVLLNLSESGIDSLVDNIHFLINKKMGVTFKEIQIDCDWTERTKKNYFYLLKNLKVLSSKKISCTLRLYAYTYPQKAGIPPVDRVSLMCYNLLNSNKNPDKNSILDLNELKLYIKNAKEYPLKVDIALPVFSWYHLYQNNIFKGYIPSYEIPESAINKPFKPLWHRCNLDIETSTQYIREGDIIKKEEVNTELLINCVDLLKKHIKFGDTTRVTFFHLDDRNLNQYETKNIHSIINHFSL